MVFVCKDVFIPIIADYAFLNTHPKLWFQTRTVTSRTDLRRYIHVHEIVPVLESTFSQALPVITNWMRYNVIHVQYWKKVFIKLHLNIMKKNLWSFSNYEKVLLLKQLTQVQTFYTHGKMQKRNS